MLRLIIACAAAGFVLLLSATVVLAWLNWSEKLYMPVITALLVGTVTGFVSIFAGLEGTSDRVLRDFGGGEPEHGHSPHHAP